MTHALTSYKQTSRRMHDVAQDVYHGLRMASSWLTHGLLMTYELLLVGFEKRDHRRDAVAQNLANDGRQQHLEQQRDQNLAAREVDSANARQPQAKHPTKVRRHYEDANHVGGERHEEGKGRVAASLGTEEHARVNCRRHCAEEQEARLDCMYVRRRRARAR